MQRIDIESGPQAEAETKELYEQVADLIDGHALFPISEALCGAIVDAIIQCAPSPQEAARLAGMCTIFIPVHLADKWPEEWRSQGIFEGGLS